MMKSDKETAGIKSNYEGETPSDKGALAEAVAWQEKNMKSDYPTGSYMPNKSKIRQYKGK